MLTISNEVTHSAMCLPLGGPHSSCVPLAEPGLLSLPLMGSSSFLWMQLLFSTITLLDLVALVFDAHAFHMILRL